MDVLLKRVFDVDDNKVKYTYNDADKDDVIFTHRNLDLIVGHAVINGYNIINLKEFLKSIKEES